MLQATYWTYSLLLYAGLSYRHQRPPSSQAEWWSTCDCCSAGACEDSKVLNCDGSVFALSTCSSDDWGEEASALWWSHQHGSLVLVDDLNLVWGRKRSWDLVQWCRSQENLKQHGRTTVWWENISCVPSPVSFVSVSSLFQETEPQSTNCFTIISLMSHTCGVLKGLVISSLLPASRCPFALFLKLHSCILVL